MNGKVEELDGKGHVDKTKEMVLLLVIHKHYRGSVAIVDPRVSF